MYTLWTTNLRDSEEKSNFHRTLYNSRTVLERIYQILEEREKALTRSETTEDAYATPNWSELQAHRNGRREEISFVKNLINLDQQKE